MKERPIIFSFAEGLNGALPQLMQADFWDSTCTKRGFAWKDNPWVWVIEFKRVDP